MFFLTKRRVEEDLERIRRANIPGEVVAIDDREGKKALVEKLDLEKNDMLAMIIAVFSIVLPYVFFFILIISVITILLGLVF